MPYSDNHPDVIKIKSIPQLPNGITPEDLLNPENPVKAPVMSFLDKFNNEYPDQKSKYTMDGKRQEGKILEAKAMECYKYYLVRKLLNFIIIFFLYLIYKNFDDF